MGFASGQLGGQVRIVCIRICTCACIPATWLMEWGGKNSSPFTGTADSCHLMRGGMPNSACLMDGGSGNPIKKQGMFHNLSHNSSELSPDSGTLLARDHLVKMKFSTAAPSTAPQRHLSLYLPSFYMLLVSSSFLNPVCFPPQIESR